MVTAVCAHNDAMVVEDEHLASAYKGNAIYNCPECGAFIDDSGEQIDGDPTSEVAENQKKSASPKAPLSPVQGDDGGSAVQLGKSGGSGTATGTSHSVSKVGQALPAKHSGTKLVPASQDADKDAASTKQKAGAAGAEQVDVGTLPGPWAGAPCPNLGEYECPGTIQPFHTLRSQPFGNTYFYQCGECGVQVILEFKQSKFKQ